MIGKSIYGFRCWLAGFLAVSVLPLAFAGRTADVYLLGGQSNMQGIAKINKLPAEQSQAHAVPHTFFWNGTRFEPLVLGKTRTSSRAGEFGPELGFALAMATEERPVYLIKYHASGQPLHHGWNGNQWEGGEPVSGRRNFYPGESLDDDTQGLLYAAMLRRFQAGIAQLEQDGLVPVVQGFLWMQGEQDSKNESSASTYAFSLKWLRNRLSSDLEMKKPLPLVYGQVLPHEPSLKRFTHRSTIRSQMAAADGSSGRPEAIEYAAMISTDGFGMLPDTVHYNAEGQLRLGRAFAEAMKRLHTLD